MFSTCCQLPFQNRARPAFPAILAFWPLFHAAHSPYEHYNDIPLFQYYRLKEAEKNAL